MSSVVNVMHLKVPVSFKETSKSTHIKSGTNTVLNYYLRVLKIQKSELNENRKWSNF